MEYFRIETEEELRQAHNQLKWNSIYSLLDELDYFRTDCSCRIIVKNRIGHHYLTKESYLSPLFSTEILNPLKNKNHGIF